MKQTPDMISTTGKFVNMTSGIPFEGNASNGDWYYNNVTKQLTYIVSGRGETGLVNRQVKLKVSLVCFLPFSSCIGFILGDPGAGKGGEGKSKRAEKYIRNDKK